MLTFSQSSFAALLVGLAVLGALRWSARRWRRRGRRGAGAARRSGARSAAAARPGQRRVGRRGHERALRADRGRRRLFAERPVAGWGSGAFAREYRRAEDVSAERAASASHTIPVTIAAEQGVIGLVAYLRAARGGACAAPARRRVAGGGRRSPRRSPRSSCTR